MLPTGKTALELLSDPKNWAKFAIFVDTTGQRSFDAQTSCRCCLKGALFLKHGVSNQEELKKASEDLQFLALLSVDENKLVHAANVLFAEEYGPFCTVEGINDRECTTHDMIVEILQYAQV